MKTNELKKGDIVKLSSGFYAEIMDNKKGNIRLANVQGIYGEEMGSIYAWDIVQLINKKNEDFSFEKIELTPAQEKAREKVRKALSFL